MSNQDNPLETTMKLNQGLQAIRAVIAAGADVSAPFQYGLEESPLCFAVRTGWTDKKEVVEALLAAGADPNIGDARGLTPLHEISYHCWHVDIAETLLDHKADINQQDATGATALHYAVRGFLRFGREEMIGLLLERGADVTIRDNKGLTAREIAEQSLTTEGARLVTLFEKSEEAAEQRRQKQLEEQADAVAQRLERLRRMKPRGPFQK